MKKTFRYLFTVLLATASVTTACTDDQTHEIQPSVVYESITFDLEDAIRAKIYTDETNTSALPMVVGEQITLTCVTTPSSEEVSFPGLNWASSDPTVASVEEGTVRALKAGSTIITVTPSTTNLVATTSLKINIVDEVVEATSITITDDAEFTDETFGLPACYTGETMTLKASIAPAEATYRTVMWSSQNPDIATVDPVSGVVTGVARGKATILASALDESGVTASHEIYIDQIISPLGVKFTTEPAERYSIDEGGCTITFETYPEVSTRSQIVWTPSDPTVATVERGVVTFLRPGTTTITATCAESDETLPDGFARTASFTVNIPAGYYNERFRNETTPWALNPSHVNSGATFERLYNASTDEYYWLVTPYLNASKVGRGDIQHSGSKVYLESGNYPILCFRIDDVNDSESKFSRNINVDTSGSAGDTKYSGWIGGNNNKWKTKYKCSDGSAILIYDLSTQNFQNGGALPTGTVAEFTTFQIKYADIKTPASAEEAQYRFFWFMTFGSEAEMTAYLNTWSEQTGITYEE
ncbi:MAG TPA: DUF4979 domain-containing protein [Candidatus Alistipes cottocaccae]|nr:DUF4979 domain-containing protein [Candidatus Alistipes cottocaccae]